MLKMKKLVMTLVGIIPTIALALGTMTVSQACVWWYHQPEVPEQMKK